MTTTDLIAVPHTGQLLDLPNESAEMLADVTVEIRRLESELREAKMLIAEEIARRCDADRKWTLEVGDWRISIKSDAPVAVWDHEALLEVLDGLVADGSISTEAMHRAIQPRTTYQVFAAGVNALLKSPELAGKIETCRTLEPPNDRRLKVEKHYG